MTANIPQHHLIVGGQRSGKSRHAERMAFQWLAQAPGHEVLVVATAQAGDAEMSARIERHRCDRDARFQVAEAPVHLGAAVRSHGAAHRLIVVDCLTLWVSQSLMPAVPSTAMGVDAPDDRLSWPALRDDFLVSIASSASPLVFVSNEIGAGVIPLGREVRQVVDELGRLHQAVAQCCAHVTWMVAGQPFTREVTRWD